jgi:hypothetical protein
MRRVILVLGVMAMSLGLLTGPVAAATGGNSANAANCEEGGYLKYTDAKGNAFKNEGQCTRYAARGGQLVPVPTAADTCRNLAIETLGPSFDPSGYTFIGGTAGNDSFTNTLGQREVFCGCGGDDVISYIEEGEFFLGGADNDAVGGNFGTFNGGAGDDYVQTNEGTFYGGDGTDSVLYPSPGSIFVQ